MIITIPHNLRNLVVTEFDSTEKLINEIGELRAIFGHVLGAAGVQIPQNNLDNLQSIKKEDGATEVSDSISSHRFWNLKFAIRNIFRVAKDLWERVQLLMQGTSLTKQEREYKLYDAFDKFANIKRESLHKYYLSFTQNMGRSGGYCFKIIACAGGDSTSESVDRDDLVQNKGSDKRGWSFRKKSAGQQVLSNTVITEISSSENKISEPIVINTEAPVTTPISEKTSANQWTKELPRVSSSNTKASTVSNTVTKATDEDAIQLDSSPDESSVILIQTAVRKFIAQRDLVRLQNVVKLQAAVRGHLVRCRAAGTLRCVQAIVKMQTLVRARHANLSVGKVSTGKK
nr:protein IQ-DOMAIN 32-like [Tanacetum cinerariifolium]